jgi:hypothetical protein
MSASSSRGNRILRRPAFWAIGFIFLFIILFFADVIFFSKGRILSVYGGDITLQFLAWRGFTAHQILSGNFPFWNPHLYSGAPFFTGMQSALFHPAILFYLIFPVPQAINLEIVFHIWTAITSTFLWLYFCGRGLHAVSALMGAFAFGLGAPYFFNLYAGHLPNLATMAWAPLIFLALDRGSVSKRERHWIALGAMGVALQIFGGHPQYVYYTGIVAAVYVLSQSFVKKQLVRGLGAYVAIYLLGAGIAAVQLLPSLASMGELMRSAGGDVEFASSFSFPPTNLLNLIMPGVFGGILAPDTYWGPGILIWEMCLFFGLGALSFSLLGLYSLSSRERKALGFCIVFGLIMALGRYTPLYYISYKVLPLFGSFRGVTKFIAPVLLLFALSTSLGCEEILRRRYNHFRSVKIWLSAFILFLFSFGLFFSIASPDGLALQSIGRFIFHYDSAAKAHHWPFGKMMEAFREDTAPQAFFSAGVLSLYLLFFFLLPRRKWARYVLVGLAFVELAVFARILRVSHELKELAPLRSALKPMLDKAKKDETRVFVDNSNNITMLFGANDIWGYDPIILRRYSELVYFSQKKVPRAEAELHLFSGHPLLRLLRLAAVSRVTESGTFERKEIEAPFPRFRFYQNYKVVPEGNAVLQELASPDTDLDRTLVLESEPSPKPSRIQDPGAKLQVIKEDTDYVELSAELSEAALLLQTDAFSRYWQISAFSDSHQQEYRILPANHALRAIALGPGKHHFALSYRPPFLYLGAFLSLLGILIWFYTGAAFFFLSRFISSKRLF